MDTSNHSISVIMTVYDQSHELEENLPSFLTQEYVPGYEVIVVDESSTDNTDDVLKLLKQEYKHLYTTFLPKPNRLVVRRKLAFNIGIKASKNEWLMFTDIKNRPQSSDILEAIAGTLQEHTVLALVYVKGQHLRLQLFDDLEAASNHILKRESYKKNMNLERRGSYLWGSYDFLMIRKNEAQEILKFFEEHLSFSQRIGIRWKCFWKNLFGRSSTILLTTE